MCIDKEAATVFSAMLWSMKIAQEAGEARIGEAAESAGFHPRPLIRFSTLYRNSWYELLDLTQHHAGTWSGLLSDLSDPCTILICAPLGGYICSLESPLRRKSSLPFINSNMSECKHRSRAWSSL